MAANKTDTLTLQDAINSIATPEMRDKCLEICRGAVHDLIIHSSLQVGVSNDEIAAEVRVLARMAKGLASLVAPPATAAVALPVFHQQRGKTRYLSGPPPSKTSPTTP